MTFLAFWRKPKPSASSDSPKEPDSTSAQEFSSFDLFYQATYMSAVAEAGVSRREIFDLVSRLPCASSHYFRKVHLLAHGLGYDYATACRMVGESAEEQAMKSLLLRLATALRSGEMTPEYLVKEAQIQAETYGNEYERDVESMTKWADAYAALTVSVTLVIVINMISTMIHEMSNTTIFATALGALMMGSSGAWIIARSSPKELTALPPPAGSKPHLLSRKLLLVLLCVTCVVSLVLGLLLKMNLGVVFLAASVLMFPIGLTSIMGDKQLAKKEEEIGSFLRTLGGTATTLQTTLMEATTRLDLRSFIALRTDVNKLRTRLMAFIDFGICWKQFMAETGSRMISQVAGVFHDSTSKGGDPEKVGFVCSLFATKIYMLRAKREAASATFVWLSMVMHMVVVALIVFIMEIVVTFQGLLSSLGVSSLAGELPLPMFSFGESQIGPLYLMIRVTSFVLSLNTALAIKMAAGGHRNSFFGYFSILLAMSGASLAFGPKLVASVFKDVIR